MNCGRLIRGAEDVEQSLSVEVTRVASVLDLRWHPCQLPPPNSSSPGAKTLARNGRIRSNRVPSLAHVKADNVLTPDLSPFLLNADRSQFVQFVTRQNTRRRRGCDATRFTSFGCY